MKEGIELSVSLSAMDSWETAERLVTLIEASPDVIFFKDEGGRWRVVNDAGLRLFDLIGESWEGKTDQELAHLYPKFADAFTKCHTTDEYTWAKGVRHGFIENIPNGNGGQLILEVIKVPLFYPDGSRRGLVVIGHDITKRTHTEEAEERQRISLRHLNEIAALSNLSLDEQFHQALAVGAAHLGLEFGIVSHITGEEYKVMYQVSPPDTLKDGQIFPFGETYKRQRGQPRIFL